MRIFRDKYGREKDWWFIIKFLFLVGVVGMTIWLAAKTMEPERIQLNNFWAQCRSIDGHVGGNACYKDGELVFEKGDS